eukprot:CAMPEP_0170452498 /NCGR_PEP_ID=MMETSP0123-20130129/1375_1 /TAXON_ID=182087 /ORGANISM="Favella ehrenbergii, Strain Fehren 1" /LENGTH=104 /DNA_ID=CAMNT_0010714521 /DNA_START=879 /DNA_END=1190 /DNA_ORIENTATION=-
MPRTILVVTSKMQLPSKKMNSERKFRMSIKTLMVLATAGPAVNSSGPHRHALKHMMREKERGSLCCPRASSSSAMSKWTQDSATDDASSGNSLITPGSTWPPLG